MTATPPRARQDIIPRDPAPQPHAWVGFVGAGLMCCRCGLLVSDPDPVWAATDGGGSLAERFGNCDGSIRPPAATGRPAVGG